MKYAVIFSILLHLVTAGFSQFELWNFFWLANDFQFFIVVCISYILCPVRQWRLKTLLFVSVVVALAVLIHNGLVQYELIPEGTPTLLSLSLVGILAIAACLPFLNRWSKLPNDKIEVGNYYEIIGKPRTDLQFLLFIWTRGKGGSYAITDGTSMIKMSKKHNQSILSKLDKNYLTGKKCIHIGADTTHNKKLFLDKIGIDFSLLKSCYSLSTGFKNV